MSDWIKQKAESIKKKQQAEANAQQRARRAHDLITSKSADFWRAMIEAIRSDVEAFNKEFPNEPWRHIELEVPDQQSATLLRKDSDEVKTVQLFATEAGITCRTVTTSPGQPQTVQDYSFSFATDEADNVGLDVFGRPGTAAQAVEVILKHLF
jgi:hypothetical protein